MGGNRTINYSLIMHIVTVEVFISFVRNETNLLIESIFL